MSGVLGQICPQVSMLLPSIWLTFPLGCLEGQGAGRTPPPATLRSCPAPQPLLITMSTAVQSVCSLKQAGSTPPPEMVALLPTTLPMLSHGHLHCASGMDLEGMVCAPESFQPLSPSLPCGPPSSWSLFFRDRCQFPGFCSPRALAHSVLPGYPDHREGQRLP